VAKDVAAALGFAAIGVVVSLAVALPQGAVASPDPGVMYVWRGMSPWDGWVCYDGWAQFAGWHPCWHSDESGGDYKAIDYNRGDQTGGSAVSLDYSYPGELMKIMPASGLCKGVRVELCQGSYDPANYKGDIHYLHIDPNEEWLNKEAPYLPQVLVGHVASDENQLCKDNNYWDAPHLHQSADVSSSTPFYANKLANPSQGDTWEHAIFWGSPSADQDGDGFSNKTEILIGTDLYDNCTDGWDDAWPLDINKDGSITVTGDLSNFSGHIGAHPGDPKWWQRLDFNADGGTTVTGDVFLYRGKVDQKCYA
jgi:hypothetical protein